MQSHCKAGSSSCGFGTEPCQLVERVLHCEDFWFRATIWTWGNLTRRLDFMHPTEMQQIQIENHNQLSLRQTLNPPISNPPAPKAPNPQPTIKILLHSPPSTPRTRLHHRMQIPTLSTPPTHHLPSTPPKSHLPCTQTHTGLSSPLLESSTSPIAITNAPNPIPPKTPPNSHVNPSPTLL